MNKIVPESIINENDKNMDSPVVREFNDLFKNRNVVESPTESGPTLEKSRPTTLTILIQTRIPNHQNINYYPSMTVPKTSSKKVLFNPIVELHKNIVVDIPPNSSSEYLYTQFFDKNSFSTLLNRTLHSYDQPKNRTLKQATEEGIIDKNIDIVLSTLFKKNNIFYIDNKPYTVFGYEWVGNDWSIDVNFEMKNRIFKNPKIKERIEKELNDTFKDDIVKKSTITANVSDEAYKYQNEYHSAALPLQFNIGTNKNVIDNQAIKPKTLETEQTSLEQTRKEEEMRNAEKKREEEKLREIEKKRKEEQDREELKNRIKRKEQYDVQEEETLETIEKDTEDITNKRVEEEEKAIEELISTEDTLLKTNILIITNLKSSLKELLENDIDDMSNDSDYNEKRKEAYNFDKTQITNDNLDDILNGDLLSRYSFYLIDDSSHFILNIIGSQENYTESIQNYFKDNDENMKDFVFNLNLLWFHYYEYLIINNLFNEIKTSIDEKRQRLDDELKMDELEVDISKCVDLINELLKLYILLCEQYQNIIKSFKNICYYLKTLFYLVELQNPEQKMPDNYEEQIKNKQDNLDMILENVCEYNLHISLKNKCEYLEKFNIEDYNTANLDFLSFINVFQGAPKQEKQNASQEDLEKEKNVFFEPTSFMKISNLQKKETISNAKEKGWFGEEGNYSDDYINYTQKMEKQYGNDSEQKQIMNEFYEKEYNKRFNQSGGENNELITNADDYDFEDFKKYKAKLNNMNLNRQYQKYLRKKENQNVDKWTYYVRVELELYPGTSIPIEDYSSLICQFRYEKIRQAWAELFGTQYAPGIFTKPSDYKPKNKTVKNEKSEKKDNVADNTKNVNKSENVEK